LEYAQTLGVRRLNCLAGVQPADTSFNQARETVVANLAFAAQVLRNAGIELLIETVNTIDAPQLDRLRIQTFKRHPLKPSLAQEVRVNNSPHNVMAKHRFIGLGIMGAPMALNLQKGGHRLFLSGGDVGPSLRT
jgi:hypothetical protein